jgi:hypothetical protein
MHGAAPQECIDCLNAGASASLCSGFNSCLENCYGGQYAVCNGAMGMPDPTLASCIEGSCCNAVQICSQGGTDPASCETCLEAGAGPACDPLIQCAQSFCGVTLHGAY